VGPPAKAKTPPARPEIPLATPVGAPAAPKPPPKTVVRPPQPQPAPSKPPPPKAEDELVEKTIRESGFDPRTGRIVDPDKFRQWKKSERSAGAQPGVTNASTFEVFRKARTAIEQWVDDDGNRLRVLHGDLSEIKQQPGVRAIFNEYAGYGYEMLEKLTRHLDFLIQNRRKYYQAMAKAGREN
jgi:hypothetical protein